MSSYLKKQVSGYLLKGIQNSPETMEFLRDQLKIIFNEQKEIWLRNQGNEPIDKEFFCEYHNEADRKACKYLGKWLSDLSLQGSFKINGCPNSIINGFEYMIADCLEYVMDEVCESLCSLIMEEIINEEEKNYEAINLQKEGFSK